MKRVTNLYFILIYICIIAGCSSSELQDFSSPEKASETIHKAAVANDMRLYEKCFLKKEDKQLIKELAKNGGLPKNVKFIKHEVRSKEILNKSEVKLWIREVIERKLEADGLPMYCISEAEINYRNTSKGWKVYSYTTTSFQKARKVGDNYEPIEENRLR